MKALGLLFLMVFLGGIMEYKIPYPQPDRDEHLLTKEIITGTLYQNVTQDAAHGIPPFARHDFPIDVRDAGKIDLYSLSERGAWLETMDKIKERLYLPIYARAEASRLDVFDKLPMFKQAVLLGEFKRERKAPIHQAMSEHAAKYPSRSISFDSVNWSRMNSETTGGVIVLDGKEHPAIVYNFGFTSWSNLGDPDYPKSDFFDYFCIDVIRDSGEIENVVFAPRYRGKEEYINTFAINGRSFAILEQINPVGFGNTAVDPNAFLVPRSDKRQVLMVETTNGVVRVIDYIEADVWTGGLGAIEGVPKSAAIISERFLVLSSSKEIVIYDFLREKFTDKHEYNDTAPNRPAYYVDELNNAFSGTYVIGSPDGFRITPEGKVERSAVRNAMMAYTKYDYIATTSHYRGSIAKHPIKKGRPEIFYTSYQDYSGHGIVYANMRRNYKLVSKNDNLYYTPDYKNYYPFFKDKLPYGHMVISALTYGVNARLVYWYHVGLGSNLEYRMMIFKLGAE